MDEDFFAHAGSQLCAADAASLSCADASFSFGSDHHGEHG